MLKIRLLTNKLMLNIYLLPFRKFSSAVKKKFRHLLRFPGVIVPVSMVRVLIFKGMNRWQKQPAAKLSTRSCHSFSWEQDIILQDGMGTEQIQGRPKTSDCH